jgi:geranylgeranyl reductase family protein
MDVGVVGAGPAGSLLSGILASKGMTVIVFDPSHPREKPCGGGVSPAAFSRFDFLDSPDLHYKKVDTITCLSPGNTQVELALDEPIRTVSRLRFDRHILDWAVRSRARWLKSKITDVERKDQGWIIHTDRGTHACDFLVGADGAHSLVRRTLLGKTSAENLIIAAGYLVRKSLCDSIVVKFVAGLKGYIWVFPRTDATSLGICGPAASARAKNLRPILDEFVRERFSGLHPGPAEAYTAAMFVRGGNLSEPFCGKRWALVGDAAGFPDPITLEGIQYALESARLLATAILEDQPERYAGMCRNAFLDEHAAGAELTRYFCRGEFLDRAVRAAVHNPDARAVLADFCSATVRYRTLKRRLVGILGRRVIDKLLQRDRGVSLRV